MAEIEYLLTSGASSVIHDTLRQNTDHSTLTRVDITNDGNSDII